MSPIWRKIVVAGVNALGFYIGAVRGFYTTLAVLHQFPYSYFERNERWYIAMVTGVSLGAIIGWWVASLCVKYCKPLRGPDSPLTELDLFGRKVYTRDPYDDTQKTG